MSNTVINAHGNEHVAICMNCGASLTYPVWVGENAYGRDCFEAVFGAEAVRFVRESRFDADAMASAKQEAAAILKSHQLRLSVTSEANAWLVQLIAPMAQVIEENGNFFGQNFFGQIYVDLKYRGTEISALPYRAASIIAEGIAKLEQSGNSRRVREARQARIQELLGRMGFSD